MMILYLVMCIRQTIFQDHSSHLPRLIGLRIIAVSLKIDSFLDSRFAENMGPHEHELRIPESQATRTSRQIECWRLRRGSRAVRGSSPHPRRYCIPIFGLEEAA